MCTKKIKSSFVVLVSAALALIGQGSYGAIKYVDASAPDGGLGTSWGSPFNDIQTAINACNTPWMLCSAPSDQIWVKKGTYALESQIAINRAVRIYGGFAGGETSVGQRDWENNETIVHGNNSVRCLNIGYFCEIDGFTIRNGRASTGGGIYIDAEPIECFLIGYMSPQIRNCTIRDNTGTTGGGGIYITQSDPTIENCTFLGNSSASGGAIYHLSASPVIEKCIFADNHSTAPGSIGGGAIGGFGRNQATDALVTIVNCLFYDNDSGSWGGAISYNGVYPSITNCTFSANTASIAGGAFHGDQYSEAPRFRNSIMWGDSPDELDIVTASTYLNVSYCDVQGGWTGPGVNNLNVNPDFAGSGNYRLDSGSRCIDSGSGAGAPSEDLDGVPRPVDGNADGTAVCDIGAFEFAFIGDFDLDGIVRLPDFSMMARAWFKKNGQAGYDPACDISIPADDRIDWKDLRVFVANWLP